MKRFRFRLERLLSIRRIQQQERAREVAELLATEAEHARRVEESESRREVAQQQIVELRRTIRSAGIQLAADNLFRTIRKDVRREREARDAVTKRADHAREAFVLARQRTRALEKLQSRRRDDWRTETERHERRTDDEVAENARRRRAQS